MENNRTEKVEALETLAEFNDKVIKNIRILVKELSGERLDDTDKFQDSIINAINWEIQVMNATMDVINEGKERIAKNSFNEKVIALGEAVRIKDDKKIAEAFTNLEPELERLGEAAREIVA